ncbi:MAG: type II secretion system protein [Capsulimonadaceae bacterium]
MSRRTADGFTLIELLVVIAIISTLAAIMFPVFASAQEKARATDCVSNMRQVGMAVQVYLQDNDDRLFFRSNWKYSRSGSTVIPSSQANPLRWWNQIMPYLHSDNVFLCPSDNAPTLSDDANGVLDVRRSYIAVAAAESLTASQVADPAETIVITEKWGKDYTGTRTDSWIEPFNGDFTPDHTNPSRMFTAGNRHLGLLSASFFDGHAVTLQAGQVQTSKAYTGCSLIYEYPYKGAGAPSVTSTSSAANQPNICAKFSYP